ncbi:MAG: cob(I)yrinic acid a,c-diamide adenosyltransferase [Deltaproteobacteria bacterium]|nr:cob(I)yrinic acid a,c-diamide adenosyltransferase [Deltaproteobacteria bacterium]
MRITRVYTGVGDRGRTRLVGGAEVSKDDLRIEAYGTVDELNAVLGVTRAVLQDRAPAAHPIVPVVDDWLDTIQNELFVVGSDLATPPDSRWTGMVRIGIDEVARLERWIDTMNSDLEPLREFVLPGGGPVGAQCHVARTVCRRAERRITSLLVAQPDIGEPVLIYMNRLSDWFFVLGRWLARQLGERETQWRNPNVKTRTT